MNAKKSINTLLNQFSGKSDMPNYIESPASYKETYTAAEVERIKRAERARGAEEETKWIWGRDFGDAYNGGYLTERGRALIQRRMDEQAAIVDGAQLNQKETNMNNEAGQSSSKTCNPTQHHFMVVNMSPIPLGPIQAEKFLTSTYKIVCDKCGEVRNV